MERTNFEGLFLKRKLVGLKSSRGYGEGQSQDEMKGKAASFEAVQGLSSRSRGSPYF